jgi:hypothetical protein
MRSENLAMNIELTADEFVVSLSNVMPSLDLISDWFCGVLTLPH